MEGGWFGEMCSGSEEGSYLRLIDSCITQLKLHGPSRTCNESKEEDEVRWSVLMVLSRHGVVTRDFVLEPSSDTGPRQPRAD